MPSPRDIRQNMHVLVLAPTRVCTWTCHLNGLCPRCQRSTETPRYSSSYVHPNPSLSTEESRARLVVPRVLPAQECRTILLRTVHQEEPHAGAQAGCDETVDWRHGRPSHGTLSAYASEFRVEPFPIDSTKLYSQWQIRTGNGAPLRRLGSLRQRLMHLPRLVQHGSHHRPGQEGRASQRRRQEGRYHTEKPPSSG